MARAHRDRRRRAMAVSGRMLLDRASTTCRMEALVR